MSKGPVFPPHKSGTENMTTRGGRAMKRRRGAKCREALGRKGREGGPMWEGDKKGKDSRAIVQEKETGERPRSGVHFMGVQRHQEIGLHGPYRMCVGMWPHKLTSRERGGEGEVRNL